MDTGSLALLAKVLKHRDSESILGPVGDSVTTCDRIKAILSRSPSMRSDSQVNTVVALSRNMNFFNELKDTVGEYALFQCCKHLTSQLQTPHSWKEVTFMHCPPCKTVFSEGDIGQQFFVIISGSCSVITQSQNASQPHKSQLLTVLRSGDCFGELALISKKPRTATVLTREACDFGVLERDDYCNILERAQEKELTRKISLLRQHPAFACWTSSDITKLSYSFRLRTIRRKQTLFLAGHPAIEVFLVQEGTFQFTKEASYSILSGSFIKKVNRDTEVMTASVGDLLGAGNVLEERKYDCSCMCSSAVATVLVISRRNFRRMVTHSDTVQKLIAEEKSKSELRVNRLNASVTAAEAHSNISILASIASLSKIAKPRAVVENGIAKLIKVTSSHLFKKKSKEAIKIMHRRTPSMPLKSVTPDLAERFRHSETIMDITTLDNLSSTIDLGKKRLPTIHLIPLKHLMLHRSSLRPSISLDEQ